MRLSSFKFRRLLWLLGALCWLAPAVAAAETKTVEVASAGPLPAGSMEAPMTSDTVALLDESVFPGLTKKISLDLRGMDLLEVLKFIATEGQLNLVSSPDVQGRVNLLLTDVSVRDVLELIVVSNALAMERRANILYIMPEAAYAQLYGRHYIDRRQSLVLQLKYANPGQVGALLGNIKSPLGRIVIDESTATVALLDVPEALAQMQELIERVDLPTVNRQVPTILRVFSLAYAKAEQVSPEVSPLLTPDIGSVKVDARSNALIVTDLPARMDKIAELIAAFDARHRQVYLETSILQVTLTDNFDAGIEWEWSSESKHFPNLNLVGSLPIASDVSGPLKLVLGTIGNNDVTATVKALKTFGDTDILSSPHIAVLNNEEARILIGRREAFITTTVTQAQSTATTAESVQFVDVGVKLFVTPVINAEGFVTLKIRPEVSSVVNTLTTSTGNKIPIVETSEAETKVMVKDGRTLVIGGLMKDETVKSHSRVPVMSDIPILGMAFRNTSDRIQKTELVILLTPHVITGEEQARPLIADAIRKEAAAPTGKGR